MSEPSWVVRSNDGWQEISVAHLETFEHEGARSIRAQLTLHGRHWDRQRSLDGFSRADVELVNDFETSLLQVILRRDALVHLSKNLESWLQDRREFELSLGEALSVGLGRSKELISSSEKPVFSFRYSTSRFQCSAAYVTDDTCLELLRKELESALALQP